MRRHLHTSAVAHLALFIALTGSAVAAPTAFEAAKKLITGKLIKDGTIAKKDLARAVRTKLGRTGTPGATGPAGPAGPQGPVGPAGVAGERGPTGADGANGAVGPEGPAGPAGSAGAAGAEGPTGPTGPAGAVGPTGAAGSNATADGPAIMSGRVDGTGAATCVVGAASGYSVTSACSASAAETRGVVVPTNKALRNAYFRLNAPVGTPLTARIDRILPFFVTLGTCSIPAGATTCTFASGANVNAGDALVATVTGGTPPTFGFGFELWNPAAAPRESVPAERGRFSGR